MTKDTLEYWLKVVGSILAAGSLFLGAAQFIRNQTVEAAKPYLQSKLKWCEEAVEKASEIATSDPGGGREDDGKILAALLGRDGAGRERAGDAGHDRVRECAERQGVTGRPEGAVDRPGARVPRRDGRLVVPGLDAVKIEVGHGPTLREDTGMKVLIKSAWGSADPTQASFPFHHANAFAEAGHEVQIFLLGEAVSLMRAAVASSVVLAGRMGMISLIFTIS